MLGHAQFLGNLVTMQAEVVAMTYCRRWKEDEGLKACTSGFESEWQWMHEDSDSNLQNWQNVQMD